MGALSVYNQVLNIVEDYLGPSAERYLTRLIQFHLNKSPDELDFKDLPKLTDWTTLTLGHLTENKSLVKDCESQLRQLSE